jgi:nitrogen fixation/metabolism regulation signal transduction histidine kinase
MNAEIDPIGEGGLQFYGKMTASITHEIKNVLAIINENIGLLEDLTLMADRGVDLDAERLKRLSRVVMKQVNRADDIAKNMNRFAHSTDVSLKTVDLNNTLDLVVALANRFASMRGVTLELKLHPEPIDIKTFPFFLMNLLWLCLDFAMSAVGDGKVVELVAEKQGSGAKVLYRRIEGLTQSDVNTFPAEPEQRLLELLRAELVVNVVHKEIVVRLIGEADKG